MCDEGYNKQYKQSNIIFRGNFSISSFPTGHVCHVLLALIKILKIETHGNSNYLCRSMILHTLNGSYAYFMDVAIELHEFIGLLLPSIFEKWRIGRVEFCR